MTTDLTFITNEEGEKLSDRFSTLIKDTRFFDCLVGYFYLSGFHLIEKPLENSKKIRILVGIKTDKETLDLINESKKQVQQTLSMSHKETKNEVEKSVVSEMASSEDSYEIEKGVNRFIDWVKSGKLEIRAYPSEKIHAKVYIMTFKEGDRDVGRVITGSSNFTKSGLADNLEFNVELKNRADYEFALKKFNELWKNSVDVSEKYVETIRKKTWLSDSITPYELYLKFLYEYLKEKINIDKAELFEQYLPDGFMKLKYQNDAVIEAKSKLEEYGGVFISDVVGLGKTYISALLANQLDGGNLVVAPPALIDKNNPGSWQNVFFNFGVRQTDFESIGKLDNIIRNGTEKYKNIFIDESHRFRTESTQMYEKLFKICKGKRVILVSATPLNNTPLDILSQIKLFQDGNKSTLPNPRVRNLNKYFKGLQKKLDGVDRKKDHDKYIKIVKKNAEDIRENVLQYLMIRRTRTSISKYYAEDLKKEGFKFPEVKNPKSIYYNFDEELDKIFDKTLELVIKEFKYTRYTPLLYLKADVSETQKQSQRNMGGFMKILLLKRLESSFFAFKKSIGRFIKSYERFIKEYNKGNVYMSKKHINKIFELLEKDDDESVQKLIEEEKAQKYSSDVFLPDFIKDLEHDLNILKKIKEMWQNIERDPKLDKFAEILSQDAILRKNKLLVFTESKETAEYLERKLKSEIEGGLLAFSSGSGENVRNTIIDNFDAKARHPRNDYRVLISTEILSEGVNLHCSNVVINYDIPWNPVRMMQRVGRINRVDSKFDSIYTYNFFPAGQINENISLKELAESKIKAFIEMLGTDAKLLTDEEIKSHDLFTRLTSRKTITGEDEEEDPELKYLNYLRNIRDKNPDLFEKIKRLPKKARTAKEHNADYNSVITFFRKGKLRKIFQTRGNMAEEVDFCNAAEILRADKKTKRERLDAEFYGHLETNKKEFDKVFGTDDMDLKYRGGRGHESKLTRILKAIRKTKEFTEDEENYILDVLDLLKKGSLPKATLKKVIKDINNEINPHKILAKIKLNITHEFFRESYASNATETSELKEIILSEYLIKKN